jgi:hypothetical protein
MWASTAPDAPKMTQFPPGWRRDCKLEVAIACLAAAIVMSPPPARAEVLVAGSIMSARVQASQAPMSEVLAALETAFGVRYRASVALARPITGSFSGPLERVIADLLNGYDYVVKTSPDAIEIAVVGRGVSNPSPTAIPAAPGWRSSIGNVRPVRDPAPSR